MLDCSIYLEPINDDLFIDCFNKSEQLLGNSIKKHISTEPFPIIDGFDIALIGVLEDRSSTDNLGCALAPDAIRKFLYQLFQPSDKCKIIDLGNIKKGNDIKDTYFALTEVLVLLIKNKIVPVIIGGSQDLTYPMYLAYEKIGQIINIVSVDHSFDLGNPEADISSTSYLHKIILRQPNFLFNYANLGYQTYYVEQKAIELMSKLLFDTYRLGVVQSNIAECEPVIRNADLLSFDISAIRCSDAPGILKARPNGLYGEEACQISRYAGMSDKLTSIGFFEMNPLSDRNYQTSQLVSQMIWYFFEGFYNRKHDNPVKDKHSDNFIKYTVSIQDNKHEIVFFKSKKSDRWWMEIPISTSKNSKFERHHLIPCSYLDYQVACNEEVPDRWWQFFQKLM